MYFKYSKLKEFAGNNYSKFGEIGRNLQKCFLLNQITEPPFVHIFDISLFAAELEEPKIGISGKGLRAISPFSHTVF